MPKSRGRHTGHRAHKPVRRSSRPPRLADVVLRDARRLSGVDDALTAEIWASGWLGRAWLDAGLGEREAEQLLCTQVCERARAVSSPTGLAAVAALARVAPATASQMMAQTINLLTQTQPPPPWQPPGRVWNWVAVAAWQAVDVWDSERVLFIDYDAPQPHTLMAHIQRAGGIQVGKLAILQPGAATGWEQLRDESDVPMSLTAEPVADVLAELADALRATDMTWPRNNDDDFVDNRALAWSRCREHLPDLPEPAELTDTERERLLDRFTTISDNVGNDAEVVRLLAELFLDYGEGYIISGPLSWSPDQVMLLLTDWLPRKAILDADQRAALPDVLRRWITFALTERGIDPRWITPVLDAVNTHLPQFRAAFDDNTAWGPAKQIATALTERGIDLTNRQAVKDAIRALNAERLAQRLIE
jgi:hypothetical protein